MVLEACIKGKQYETALETFQGAKSKGLSVDVITYQLAFEACRKVRGQTILHIHTIRLHTHKHTHTHTRTHTHTHTH